MVLRGRLLNREGVYNIEIKDGWIADVAACPNEACSDDVPLILPGLFDIQINGYVGVTFSSPAITTDDFKRCIKALWQRGVVNICPTITTNTHEAILHAIKVIAKTCREDKAIRETVIGIHLEGPYISGEDGPRGAHPQQYVKDPDLDELKKFNEAADGRISIVTLAPERHGAFECIEKLSNEGILVALGHTAASPEQISKAIAKGARLVSHIGNGVHTYLHRHDCYIWEELARNELWASIITDGIHLPDNFINCVFCCKGLEKTVLISDASGLAGLPPGEYKAGAGHLLRVEEELKIVRADSGRLSGSAYNLTQCVEYAMQLDELTLPQVIDMATYNPSKLLGIDNDYGTLTMGKRANLSVVNEKIDSGKIEVVKSIVGGEVVFDSEKVASSR